MKPIVIAHRGYSGKYPENTLASFRAALREKAEMIECDLHLTKDAQVVVTHDYKLGRCIPGKGYIFRKNFSEFSSKSNGQWFDSRFANERTPLLHELLRLVEQSNVELNLEIKGKVQEVLGGVDRFTRAVYTAVTEEGQNERVLISSFEPRILLAAEKLNRKLKPAARIRLALLDHEPQDRTQFKARLKTARSIGAYSYNPNFRCLTWEAVQALREQKLKVFPYTANTPAEFAFLLSLGVDGIITNEVTGLQRYLASRGS